MPPQTPIASNQSTLDPQAVNLAKAIRQSESGGNFTAQGKSGEYGAYQWTEPTWQKMAANAGINTPLQQTTPEQQNEVAYKQIKAWKDKGFNVGQIASLWNAGEGNPDAYLQGNSGTNKYGVHYDTAAYAKSVADTYQKLKQGGQQDEPDPNNPSSTAAPQPQQQNDQPSLAGFFANTVKSGTNFAGGLASAFFHPIKTVENLGNLAVGAGEKLGGAVMGKDINTPQTQSFQHLMDVYSQRYGGLGNIAKTAYEDPIGFAADASTLLGGAGALAAASDIGDVGNVLSKAGEAINPLSIPGKAVGKVSDALQSSASKGYSDALAATTKSDKLLTKPIVEGRDVNLPSGEQYHVPGLIERGVKGSLNKISDTVDENLQNVGKQYDTAEKAIPGSTKLEVQPILDQLDEVKKEFTINGANGPVIADPAAVQHLSDFQDTIKKLSSEGLVSKDSLTQLKQLWQSKVARAGGYYGKTLAEGSQVDMLGEAEKAIRRQLDTQFPDVAKINGEFKFWKDAEKVVNDTILRKTGQSGIVSKIGWEMAGGLASLPFGGPLSGLGGITLGEGIRMVVTSPTWKTTSSIIKDRLASAIASGNAVKIGEIIKQIGVPVSRTSQ